MTKQVTITNHDKLSAFRYSFFIAFVLFTMISAHSAASVSMRPKDSLPDVFIKAVPSKSKIYVGESLTVSYVLYHTVSIDDPQKQIEFTFKNCFWEEFHHETAQSMETINGKRYHTVVLRKLLLIPQAEGSLVIPQVEVELQIELPPAKGDFFEEERLVSKKIRSQENQITVVALPAKTDTVPFSGAVGSFTLAGNFEAEKKGSNTATIQINITGTGNIGFSGPDISQLPAGIETRNKNNAETHKLLSSGEKVIHSFSLGLITKYKGDYHIPAFSFLYFDPARARYIKLSSPPFDWHVTQGEPMPPSLRNGNSHAGNALVLYTMHSLEQTGLWRAVFRVPIFYVLAMLICGLFLSGIICATILKKRDRDPAKYNYKKAARRATKSIKKLASKSAAVDDDNFSKALLEVIDQYLCDKMHLPQTQIDRLAIASILCTKRVPNNTLTSVTDFIEAQNQTRFSENKKNVASREQSLETAFQLIHELDTHI